MRPVLRLLPRTLALLAAGGALGAQAQVLAPDYALTAPSLPVAPELELHQPLLAWGPVRLAAAGAQNGSGLSFEAGQRWFARAAVGSTLAVEGMSLGGGYRFSDGGALSLHVTRQFGQESLGLAVRYDLRRAYLRFAYESPVRAGVPDALRLSAGVRF